MTDRFVLSHIRRLPVFERLTPEQLALVATIVQALRYEPGEVIIREGQRNEGLLLFVSGRAALTQTAPGGREVTVGTVSANEYLNESSLFAETVATASLRVLETAIVLFVPRQPLAALIAQHPDIHSALQLARAHFSADPSQKVFKTQRENEKVLAVFRAHWWSFAGKLWIPFFIAIILFVLSALAGAVPVLSAFLFLLGLVVPGALALYLFAEWRNDKVIITDQRVTRIRRTIHNWATNISEIPIAAVREVNVSIPPTDPFARLFDYGNLIVKTSGDTLNLVLDHVPNPKAVQNIIFTHRDRYQENAARQNREAMRQELEVFLGRTPAKPADSPVMPVPPVTAARVGFLQMRFVNEKGDIVYRKHYLIWLWHITLPVLVILGGIVLFAVSAFQVVGAASGGLGLAGFALAFLVTLAGAGALYLADWDWRNDMYILGNQTISLIHRRPLWLQDRNDQILLSQVDNVISEMRGFLHTLVQMGDVKLLLMGTEVENAKVFKNVHRPQQIQQEIAERRRRAQTEQSEAEARRQRQAILDYLAIYHDSLKDAAQDANVAGQSAEPPPVPPQPPAQPPQVFDRTRPPGIPRIRRDGS
ncbi:MAG: cyclic nucleotide-binding domain-containing protein [Chloroflexi bacterium]|nr:cyclic nucleotide-binding domain-containing protein [Chloroflexota bacterium]